VRKISLNLHFDKCTKIYSYCIDTSNKIIVYTLKNSGTQHVYIRVGQLPGVPMRYDALITSYIRIPVWYIVGALHTLACVDISVPIPAAGTPDLPLLHMLVTNINGSDLGSGDVIQPYRGPAPPDHLNHTYIFLLYSQKLVHSENETRDYLTEGCSARLSGR
jgi:hypothetical protein